MPVSPEAALPAWRSGPVRWFIALPLPEAVREAAHGLAVDARRVCPDLRATPAGRMHLTLRFLGEVASEAAEAIPHLLDEAVRGTGLVDLHLAGAGTFGRPPRVLWVGAAEGGDAFALLARRIDERLDPLLGPRDKPATPHLTLGRVRGRGSSSLRRAAEHLGAAELGRVVVDEVILFDSRLGPGGPVYERVATVPLAGPRVG